MSTDSNTENLANQEAIEKLKELATKTDIGMLCTHPENTRHVHAVPMSTQEVDENGSIWFLFSSESDTFEHLQHDSEVCLLYSNPSDYSFLSIHADTEVSQNPEKIEKYWNSMVEGWFEKGKEDPRIRVLEVKPHDAHYWDTKSNKLVTFLKVAYAGITGEKLDVGRSGDLNL